VLLAFLLRHIVDTDARLVVRDRAHALTIGDVRVGRTAEVDNVRLVRLAEAVAIDQHGDSLAGLAGGEGQRATCGLVIAAGGGGAVAGGVGDADRLGAGGGQGDGEGGGSGARVP